jgi:hypothetical protein
MWGLITAFAVVGSLVAVAYREKADPVIKPALQKSRLAMLARMPASRLTLDQAEDGMVLSRKFEEHDLEKRFAAVAKQLKKGRRR